MLAGGNLAGVTGARGEGRGAGSTLILSLRAIRLIANGYNESGDPVSQVADLATHPSPSVPRYRTSLVARVELLICRSNPFGVVVW
jgi:hypothetical protein